MYRVAEASLGLLRGCAPCMAAQPVGTLLPDRSEELHAMSSQGDMSDAMQPRAGGGSLAPWDDREHSHAGGRGPAAYDYAVQHGATKDSVDDPLISDLHSERELDPPELRLRPSDGNGSAPEVEGAAEGEGAGGPAARNEQGAAGDDAGPGGGRTSSHILSELEGVQAPPPQEGDGGQQCGSWPQQQGSSSGGQASSNVVAGPRRTFSTLRSGPR